MRVVSTLVLGVALTVSGCLSFEDPINADGVFLEQQRTFSAALRWSQWDQAAEFVEPELRGEFRALTQELREVRLTDYTVQDVEIESLRTNATAVVVYRGFELSMPVERSITVHQSWRWDVEKHRWFVTPDVDARQRMSEAGFRSVP